MVSITRRSVVQIHFPPPNVRKEYDPAILEVVGFYFWLLASVDFQMDTKIRGDIAEQAAVLHALKRGWGVLKPVGDRLPYDLVFDLNGTLLKIQVKYAWLDEPSGNFVVDNRRTKTNRRVMIRGIYSKTDFDFALAYIESLDLFYIFPVAVFIAYGSEIHLVESEKRQRKPRSFPYRDAWDLILLACPNNLSDNIQSSMKSKAGF
jgi:hypothetical protein